MCFNLGTCERFCMSQVILHNNSQKTLFGPNRSVEGCVVHHSHARIQSVRGTTI